MTLDFESEYLYFTLIANKPKTRVFGVCSKSSDVQLGIIKWHGPWRQYCFFPASDTLYSRGCLQDINNFLEMLK